MKVNTFANVAQKVRPISNDNNNQSDKNRTLIKKLMQLEPNDWPKFQEKLKTIHSVEIFQLCL